MALKVVTVQRIIKAILVAGVVSCLLYVALIDFSLRPKSGIPIHIPGPGAVFELEQPPNRMQVVQPFEVVPEKYNEAVVKGRLLNEKIKRLTGIVLGQQDEIPATNHTGINYNVHIFYYCPVDWFPHHHQNQQNQEQRNKSDDDSLNIVFYPELGIYNCSKETIDRHFGQMNESGIGVVLLSWTRRHKKLTPEIMETLFDEAKKFKLKISFVLEDFPGRTVQDVQDQVEFIIDNYSENENFNRIYDKQRGRYFPVFYIKVGHKSAIKESDWRTIFGSPKQQPKSLRTTKYDSIFLNQITTKDSLGSSKRSNFDGFFSYSACNGESFASSWKNWEQISRFADQYKMLFVPTLGPGFVEKIWKGRRDQKEKHHLVRHRGSGNYYAVGWRTAIQLNKDPFISISSFNNWAEGTQIEPAVQRDSFRDYANHHGNYSSDKYLQLTRYWIGEFTHKKNRGEGQHFCHAPPRNSTKAEELGQRLVKGIEHRSRV